MNFRKISFWVLSCVFSISMAGCKSGKSNNQNEAITDSVWTKSKVIETIKKVNDYWQAERKYQVKDLRMFSENDTRFLKEFEAAY